MLKILTYTMDEKEAGLSIEEFLRSRGYSRHLIVHLKKTDSGITVGGELKYITYLLKASDVLTIRLLEETSSETIVPVKMPIDIVYEDDDLLIINKASDTPVHPSQGNFSNTLANGLAYYYREQGRVFTFRCINRLDRDTTGLMILAKNMLSACILSDMVKSKSIRREYLAVAKGLLPDSGIIDAPIGRLPGSTIERFIDYENGDRSVTHFSRLEYRNGHSLAALRLETGRTHQIRVHMKHLGYPLPGDFIYCPDFAHIKRQALHSWRLSFSHPLTGTPMFFEVPLPEDMKQILV